MEQIIVSIISGILAFCGVVYSNLKASKITEYKIEELTREVREHNNFAKRMPVVEERIKSLTSRIDKLEKEMK